VVEAAWELRKGLPAKPDCSHFVHAVYQQVGLDYEYAPSPAIFEGIDGFKRVSTPQPGDLIVWPGHVGIIIDPSEHSFYSSVVKGFALEDYKSRYWARRGRPRFYRYLIDETQAAHLRAHADLAQTASNRVTKQPPVPRVITDHEEDSADDADEGSTPAPEASPSRAHAEVVSADAEIFEKVLVSSQSRPSKVEVRAALVRAAGANGERALREGLKDAQIVAVADEFIVDELHIEGHSGWAVLKFTTTASIQNGKADLHRRTIRWRMALHRETPGWLMFVPREKTCVSHDQAIQALTARLEHLSHEGENAPQFRRTVKVLDDLLAGQPRYVPVNGTE